MNKKEELTQQQLNYYAQAQEVAKSLTGWDKVVHEVATQGVISYNLQKITELNLEELQSKPEYYLLILNVHIELPKSKKDWVYWRSAAIHDFLHSAVYLPTTHKGEDDLHIVQQEIQLGRSYFENDALNEFLISSLQARWEFEPDIAAREKHKAKVLIPAAPTPTPAKKLDKVLVGAIALSISLCLGVVGMAICISNSYKSDDPCQMLDDTGHRMYYDDCSPIK